MTTKPEWQPVDSTDALRIERDGSVLRVTFARPETRNAVPIGALRVLAETIEQAGLDADLRAVLIAGDGDHFCSGVDLKDANARMHSPRIGHIQRDMAAGAHRAIVAVSKVQLPVIAAVRGHAAAFGCSLALACDYVLASRSALFSQPFTGRGFVPDSGGAFLLPRLVGLARAKRMLMLGQPVDGETAAAWGLVAEVVTDDEFDQTTEHVVRQFADAATVAVGLTKELVHRSLHLGLADSLAEEGFIQEVALRSDDFKEGLRSFAEKRSPEFSGR